MAAKHGVTTGLIAFGSVLLASCSAEIEAAREDATVQGEAVTSASPATASRTQSCLTYGEWRRTLTSDGPSYPLPVFAPETEQRCVSVFRDQRTDYITLAPPNARPVPSSARLIFGQAPEGEPPADIYGTDTIVISGTTALGGQSNADAVLNTKWEKPLFGHSGGHPFASWRSVTVTGTLPRQELTAAMRSLEGRWRPLRAGATANDRLDGMKVAANWQALSPGHHTLATLGAQPGGKTVNASFVQLDKTGALVVAYVFPAEGNSVSCLAGTLSPAGKLTKLRFTDPLFGGEEGTEAVQYVGDTWPDHLSDGPVRPASPAILRSLRENEWGPDLCRKAFAHPGQMGTPDAS